MCVCVWWWWLQSGAPSVTRQQQRGGPPPPPERTKKKRRVIAHHYHQPTNQPLSIHRLKLELFREMVICHLYTMNLFSSSSSNTRPLVIFFFTTITQRDIVHYSCHTLVVSLSFSFFHVKWENVNQQKFG